MKALGFLRCARTAAVSLRVSVFACAMTVSVVACGDDDSSSPGAGAADAGADAATGTPTSRGKVDVPTSVLELASAHSCRLDEDCAKDLHCFHAACVWECNKDSDCNNGDTCSPRRRCELAQQNGAAGKPNPATPEVAAGIGVVQAPPEVVRIEAGKTDATITIKTDKHVPGGAIGYTIETYSYGTQQSALPDQLFKAKGTDTFQLTVPTGSANPNDKHPGLVEVQLVTSVGTFRTKLQPKPTLSGNYGGTVTINRFGSVGLPIDFEVVTDPYTAEIADAEHVYLVLPVKLGAAFSPKAPATDGTASAVKIELKYSDFSQTWVGTVRAPFSFAASSTLGRYGASKVMRGLRFELKAQDRVLSGTVRDSWEGLYDARTSDGVASAATVVFDGKLDVQRVGPARALADVPATLASDNTEVAAQPLPDVAGACKDAQFTVPDVTIHSVIMNCSGIGNAAAFTSAASADQTRCAIAVAEHALSAGTTTAKMIDAYLKGDTDTTGKETFADFMKRCAAGTNGSCRPSADVTCGRAATAYAAATQHTPDGNFGAVFDAYARTTRESFLGRQLGAYQSDADTRLEWLKTTDYPAIVTSAVRDLNEQLISDWRMNVLDAHFGSLSGQYDGSGLAVLARQVQDQPLSDARQLLLMEMTQTWRSTMEALTVATRRWNDIYQDMGPRADAAKFVSGQAFDLYVLSGLVDDLNVAAGSGYASFGLAAGYGDLLRELAHLNQPFNALIFDRDAEVVVARSLDPLKKDENVLSDLQMAAKKEIDAATMLVNGILDRAKQMAVDEQLLRDDLNNQVDANFDELVTLCGLPDGCAVEDREKPECWPEVALGRCGFALSVANKGTDTAPALDVQVTGFAPKSNVSDATAAVLEMQKAIQAQDDSVVALADYRKVTDQMLDTNATRKKDLEDLADEADAKQMAVDQQWDKVKAAQASGLEDVDKFIMDSKSARTDAYNARKTAIDEVNNVRQSNTTSDIASLRASASLSATSSTLRAAAERADTLTELFAEGIPDTPDDIGGPLKASIKLSTSGITSGMDIAAQAAELAATGVETESEIRDELNEDMLAKLESKADLDDKKAENDLSDIEDKLMLATVKNDQAESAARDAIDILWGELSYDEEVARDLNLLYEKRDEIFARIVEEHDRSAAVQQAGLTVIQKRVAYESIVQRAQLLDGRLHNLIEQRKLINLNLGSPSVVFGWANKLEQAETRLDRAKDKLMDWVVALEYLAVRPFMDARIQVLLARNTYQLTEIASELDAIQDRCGGAINSNTATISLRDDIMHLDASLKDPASKNVLSPAEQFRGILARGSIPGDTRVRFSADATLGDLVSRGGVWAASFNLSLSDFANLGASCNAKVQEISLELDGTNLGKGSPTIGLAYDGTSSVRSCQPDIADIVEGIGREATSFGPVTLFRTPGRVLAPIAGVSKFGDPNQTLVGLPLSSQYTVIIDPTLGENAMIDWNKLDDVKIKIKYGYQDFYPKGQCY